MRQAAGEVPGHDKGRGYEIGKGQFLLIEDEELEAIEIESTHTIDMCYASASPKIMQ
jgi:DNA end-binding protein Ku